MRACHRQYLAHRPRNCSLVSAEPTFTSGFLDESSGSRIDDEAVVAAAFRILSARVGRGSVLSSPAVTRAYVALRFAGLEHEMFSCLYLNVRNRVLACEDLFRGTLDGASVYPREVVKRVLAHNAAAVILVHNHPSGSPDPSQADDLITRRLQQALALIDVRVVDHLIVGETVVSYAESGRL